MKQQWFNYNSTCKAIYKELSFKNTFILILAVQKAEKEMLASKMQVFAEEPKDELQ